MDWQERKIAVTGATGFVGRHLVTELLEQGARVWAFIRDESLPGHKNLRMVRGDLTDFDSVYRLIFESDPHLCFHLGAIAPVGQGYTAPLQTIKANVLGTAHVLHACYTFGNVPLVVSSSDKAYGKPRVLPVNEETPLNPLHPYDASKAAADLIARAYMASYAENISIIRCANIYGPGDLEWSRLIPGCIKAVLHGREFHVRSNGTPIRDYLYIDDAVEAYLKLGWHTLASFEPGRMICNISGGQRKTVKEVIELIIGIMDKSTKISYHNWALDETQELSVDGSLYERHFGPSPYTNFHDGLSYTIEWLADYFGFP
jgi:CDP-glucose 4,6-dehydratase